MTIKDFDNQDELASPYSCYASQSWSLIPCYGIADGACSCGKPHSGRNDAGKHPVITDWNNESTGDPTKLQEWFGGKSINNIGLNCRASGLVVIDIDPRNGGDESLSKLEDILGENFPVTAQALTGQYVVDGKVCRGRHFYFLAENGERFQGSFQGLDLPGIDIKHNGYVIVAPSRHISGVPYQWVEGFEPWTVPPVRPSEAMLGLMLKNDHNPHLSPTHVIDEETLISLLASEVSATPYAKKALESEAGKVASSRLSGNRNNTLHKAAFSMGQLIGEGQIGTQEVITTLTQAARIAFSGENAETEIASVLRLRGGGLEAGMKNPRTPSTLISATSSLLPDENFIETLHEIDWDILWADKTVERWLVPGIICAGRGHALYSDAGVGKSLLMREISAGLASGKRVMGREEIAPISVLYIDQENSPVGDIRRSLIDMGFTPADLENLHFLSFPEFSPFDTHAGGEQLKRALDHYKPELVVLDTLSRMVEGKENENDTWIAFYNYVGRELKSRIIAYVRLDHVGKNAEAGARGGSAKKSDVDLIWYMTKTSGNRFKLSNKKSRVPLEQTDFTIERCLAPLKHLLIGGGATKFDWATMAEEASESEKLINLIESFLDANPSHPTGLAKLWNALRDECAVLGVTRRDFDEVRKFVLGIPGPDEGEYWDHP